jgi:signal transduction histidine kinase
MLQGLRMIAADDDEMSLEMLSTMLCSLGVHCSTVANGREALEAIETNPDTDIMLLDLQMPIMDGFEVLSQCKSNPYLCDIPIIVLAADHQEKLKSLKLGADDFLAKPYDLEELELRITKLVHSRRQAQSANRAKHEFLTIASHELRTPMHQIMGLAGLIEGEEPGKDQREFIGLLKQATGNLTKVTTDILNYVQLDHGETSSMAEPFSLRTILQDALDSQKESAAQRGIRFELCISDDVSDALNGLSSHVYKVLNILIENVVKFSSPGEVAIVIQEDSLGKFSSRFCCSVHDKGIGIPAEFHEKIFEPFVQVDSSRSRKYEGLGIGLAIAKRMVELMGGTMSVRSDEGNGSTFNFSFYCNLQRNGVPK